MRIARISIRRPRHDQRRRSTQLLLQRGSQSDQPGQYSGVVDLAIDPGFDNAKVTVTVDGQKVADGLMSPYHVVVDLRPDAARSTRSRSRPTARTGSARSGRRRSTAVCCRSRCASEPIDSAAGLFEVDATSPDDDPDRDRAAVGQRTGRRHGHRGALPFHGAGHAARQRLRAGDGEDEGGRRGRGLLVRRRQRARRRAAGAHGADLRLRRRPQRQ